MQDNQKGIKKLLFFYPHKVRESTESEKEKYHYWDKIFMFKRGFYIVHNNFDDRHFKKSINRRINGFYKYYKKSRKNESLWYIYSAGCNAFFLWNSSFCCRSPCPRHPHENPLWKSCNINSRYYSSGKNCYRTFHCNANGS